MKVKRLFPVLLIVFPYLLIAPIVLHCLGISMQSSLFNRLYIPIFLALFLVIGGCSLLYPLFTKAAPKNLAFWNMVIKLCHIPFYILIFIIGIAFMIVIPLLFFIDMLFLLMSSAYGISALVRAKKQGSIGTPFLAANILCHLFFVADVVSAVVVYLKLRR